MKKRKKGNGVGRPTIMTKKILAKLEGAFALGHSDAEACIIAEIDKATLYRYCNKHRNFATKKELLKHTPAIKARRNIIEALNNKDIDTSKWYMERKVKEEFSNRQEVKDVTEEDNEAVKLLKEIIDSHEKPVRSK